MQTQAVNAVVRGFNAGSLVNTAATLASGLGALVRAQLCTVVCFSAERCRVLFDARLTFLATSAFARMAACTSQVLQLHRACKRMRAGLVTDAVHFARFARPQVYARTRSAVTTSTRLVPPAASLARAGTAPATQSSSSTSTVRRHAQTLTHASVASIVITRARRQAYAHRLTVSPIIRTFTQRRRW